MRQLTLWDGNRRSKVAMLIRFKYEVIIGAENILINYDTFNE